MSQSKAKEKGTPKSLLRLASADAMAASELASEVASEFEGLGLEGRNLDTEMVLPLCREAQAKLQAVANRIEQYADIAGLSGRTEREEE